MFTSKDDVGEWFSVIFPWCQRILLNHIFFPPSNSDHESVKIILKTEWIAYAQGLLSLMLESSTLWFKILSSNCCKQNSIEEGEQKEFKL